MLTRPVQSDADLHRLQALLANRVQPFTVTVREGLPRSTPQNRLQQQWCKDVATQLGDRTPEEVRGYCKLHFGVPIRREEPEYDAAYRADVLGLPYERKLRLMMEPFDLAVTRDMTTKQLTRYLDAMQAHFSAQGVILTDPEARK